MTTPVQIRERHPLRRSAHARSKARRFDWILVASVLALAVIGTLLVWSATRHELAAAGHDGQGVLQRHLLNLAIGLALGLGTALVDLRLLRAYAPFVYVASCVGLIAVLVLGTTIHGAHSWIVLGGGFQVQPSEFAKVGLVVSMAMLLGETRDAESNPRGSDVAVVLALAAVPLSLVMLQPDVGTAIVLAFVILGVLAVSGASAKWLGGLVLAGALAAVLAVQFGVLKDYQVERFTAFANPAADADGAGYATRQARIAIGSGGLFGKGLFQGDQTSGAFIPEQQTDFIFTVAGEELGLFGGGLIIALFGVILWRGLSIAARAPDLFGRLVATGVVAWFAFQAFVNVGMTLGIMPVTGLPLPFVSYGGSAMFANMMAVGLLLNVHLRSTEP